MAEDINVGEVLILGSPPGVTRARRSLNQHSNLSDAIIHVQEESRTSPDQFEVEED